VDEELQDSSYTRQVGLRLRAVRRAKRLSLHDVEMDSAKEFKASVLGAYERGERAISVPRLQRLAAFYGVAVDQLLPPVMNRSSTSTPIERRPNPRGITIDLNRLENINTQEAALLTRYVSMIRAQRMEPTGNELTMRREDLNALAVLLETDIDGVKGRIAALGFELVS
jgi:transcriptional regulator with XRE-family HTH domain